MSYILIAYATKKICLCKDSLLHFLNIQTKLHKVIAHFYRLNYNSCSVICGFVFWKFLIKKIINQGKNIYHFLSKLEEKRKGNFFKISSRIHKYNKNLYIFNPQKKKKKTPTNFLYNIFSQTAFLSLSIIFLTNKRLPHITPFFVTDNLFVAQGMQVTAGAKLHDNATEMQGFKLGVELRQKRVDGPASSSPSPLSAPSSSPRPLCPPPSSRRCHLHFKKFVLVFSIF